MSNYSQIYSQQKAQQITAAKTNTLLAAFRDKVAASTANFTESTVYKSTVDSLVLSCTLQRIISDPARVVEHVTIQSDIVYQNVTDADVERATAVRNYYQQRIVLWKLRGTELSRFRKDLESYIVTDGKMYEKEQLGMITKLPYFYDYDVAIDSMRDEHFGESATLNRVNDGVITLYPVQSLIRKTKSYSRRVYWFNLDNSGVGVSYGVDKYNPLLMHFDSLFNMRRPMVFRANLEPSKREGFQHYVLTKIHSAVPD